MQPVPGRLDPGLIRVKPREPAHAGSEAEQAAQRGRLQKRACGISYFGEILLHELLQFAVARFSEVRLNPLKQSRISGER
jgi:hypothetical protein